MSAELLGHVVAFRRDGCTWLATGEYLVGAAAAEAYAAEAGAREMAEVLVCEVRAVALTGLFELGES